MMCSFVWDKLFHVMLRPVKSTLGPSELEVIQLSLIFFPQISHLLLLNWTTIQKQCGQQVEEGDSAFMGPRLECCIQLWACQHRKDMRTRSQESHGNYQSWRAPPLRKGWAGAAQLEKRRLCVDHATGFQCI